MFDYQAPKNLLNERIILVTGASEGIGRAAAKSYAEHGASVILHGRNQERLESLYDEIMAQGLAEPAIIVSDFAKASYEDFQVLQNSIGQMFGRLDGVLHNAGALLSHSPIASTTYTSWQETLQVNLNARFILSKLLLPLLEQSDNASMIFTSSGVAIEPRAYWGSYSVSKCASDALMKILADELENISTVRINSINPGATNTAMRRKACPGELATTNPLPEQIMPLYLYLMGKDSLHINGQILNAQ